MGLVQKYVEIQMQERRARPPLKLVIEPNLAVRYGATGGARVEGTVTQRWGTEEGEWDRLGRKRATTISQPFQ